MSLEAYYPKRLSERRSHAGSKGLTRVRHPGR